MTSDGGRFEAGLYERLVTAALDHQLQALDERRVVRRDLAREEAPDRVALHLSQQVERTLRLVPDDSRLDVAVQLVDAVLRSLSSTVPAAEFGDEQLAVPPAVLKAITDIQADGTSRTISAPLIPLLDTTLLTNARGEPNVGSQIQAEIDSANDIAILMAFVRRSGIRPLLDELRRHCERGGRLRVLTTTYTGSTELEALELLTSIGAEVKVSYDTGVNRLHAKAWLFERASGYSTAYVGSSNATYTALGDGLEWNVRLSAARNPSVIEKVAAVFESYWADPDFRAFDGEEFAEAHAATSTASIPSTFISPVAVTPRPFQARLLELIALSRRRGHHRNLLVSATGTGKTVMAALDYAELRQGLPRARLLFVAHRQEILNQSQATFRQVLHDANFGEQWIGGKRPRHFEHVFASVQSLASADLSALDPTHFDVVIVDEFHHGAAPTYERLLDHLEPVELLGLTATPERADGKPILHWFGDRIAAELRLWDAIDQQYLSPFVYYGIYDELDLRQIPWKRGIGYDVDALSNLVTGNDVWARQVVRQFADRVDDLDTVRALGFCVSIDHAHFMARTFNDAGIPAVAISGQTASEPRREALRRLRDGEIRIVFSVDVFGEGVDVPNVDAIVMLRPTESATVFLQQLGRGLRRERDKTHCTVLDFVGQHRKEFRFDRRFRALLGGTRKDLQDQIANGFPFLPAGCRMHLDRVAADVILQSLKSALPTTWKQRLEELLNLASAGHETTLASYLDHTGLELEDVYSRSDWSWSALREAAGLEVAPPGPGEVVLRKAIGRLLHVDDEVRLGSWSALVARPAPDVGTLSERNRRLVRMLVAQLVESVPPSVLPATASLGEAVAFVWQHPQVLSELGELFSALSDRIEHVQEDLPGRVDAPLRVHARYTRIEVLVAFGDGQRARAPQWREGVKHLEEAKADVFLVTLDKSSGAFSPTTRYRDFAINRELFHWESQSNTTEASKTGQRYIHHVERGSDVYLFGRLRNDERAFWFLGPGTYHGHVGERPMAVTWKLGMPLPGDLHAEFAAISAVA